MNLMPIATKDDLVYFMQTGVLRLGHYDRKFIENLLFQISANEPITTNQVKLFDILVEKYERQLSKQGLSRQKANNLRWKCKVVQSEKKYTEAYIEISDNKIYFRAPYNKKFLDKIRNYDNSGFKWDKAQRAHISTYSTYSFKAIVTVSTEIYPMVNFCTVTRELLNQVLMYEDVKYWDPTLVCVNGNYLIASTNTHLDAGIQHISLDTTLDTLCKLAHHGIRIDESITNKDPLLEFASNYFVEFDYVNLDTLIEYLKKINCTGVKLWGNGLLSQHKRAIIEKLLDHKFKLVHNPREGTHNNLVSIVNHSALKTVIRHYEQYKEFSKIVLLKNSSPVNIYR